MSKGVADENGNVQRFGKGISSDWGDFANRTCPRVSRLCCQAAILLKSFVKTLLDPVSGSEEYPSRTGEIVEQGRKIKYADGRDQRSSA